MRVFFFFLRVRKRANPRANPARTRLTHGLCEPVNLTHFYMSPNFNNSTHHFYLSSPVGSRVVTRFNGFAFNTPYFRKSAVRRITFLVRKQDKRPTRTESNKSILYAMRRISIKHTINL